MSDEPSDILRDTSPSLPRPQVVLNVNDDESSRYLVSHMLRAAGFAVVEAGTAAEALALVRSRPDLVVLDIKLPDGNGLDVCRAIKSSPATADVVVLHLSATRVTSEYRAEGLESGADGYLTHPVEPREFIATVRALLRARSAEEQALREARAWQASFDAIRDGVALVDRGWNIIRSNRALARALSLEPEALAGRRFDALFTSQLGVPFPLEGLSLSGLGARQTVEVGSGERWFTLSVDPVQVPRAFDDGAVLLLVDITSRKLLEEELRRRAEDAAETSRRKDEFLAMLAHELRNPLAAITASMHLLERLATSDPQPERLRGIVNRQIKQLTRLVEDLLDVSRITRGKVELRREPVNLTALVTSVASASRGLMDARKHTLKLSVPGRAVPLLGDAVRLEQVLHNLLSNAAKYTPPGGRVAVTLDVETVEGADWARLTIDDSGIGIPREGLGRVFELFYQVDATIDRQSGGLGVGLTLVKQLVELHGGGVEVQSAGRNQGSRFIVRLPIAPEEQAGNGASEVAAAPAAALRVLLVEDHEDVREMLCAVLERWGHQVETASDGQAGLERALAGGHDAVLVDIGLPLLDGYEVARGVRADPRGARVPLIALTGYGRAEDRAEALAAGFDLHLVKPVDPEELMRALAGVVRERSRAG